MDHKAIVIQVLDGKIVLSYTADDLTAVRCRLAAASTPSALTCGTRFSWTDGPAGDIAVTCPWGNAFELRSTANTAAGRDPRGEQPGQRSVPQGIPELRIYVDTAADLEGVARFYTELFGAVVSRHGDTVAVACGPLQELIFTRRPAGVPSTASDYHVSMYVDDFEGIFRSPTPKQFNVGGMFISDFVSQQLCI
jgi:hypothetical protein